MPLYIVNESRRKLDCTIKCQTNVYTVVISNTQTFPNQFQKISQSLEKFPNPFGIM